MKFLKEGQRHAHLSLVPLFVWKLLCADKQAGDVGDRQWDRLFARKRAELVLSLAPTTQMTQVSSAGSGFWISDRDLHHIKEIAQTPSFSFLVSSWLLPHPLCQPHWNSKEQGQGNGRPPFQRQSMACPFILCKIKKLLFTFCHQKLSTASSPQKCYARCQGNSSVFFTFESIKVIFWQSKHMYPREVQFYQILSVTKVLFFLFQNFKTIQTYKADIKSYCSNN